MVNYSNSKIYKICSFQTDLIYIGSTTQPLSKRLAKHRSDYINNKGITSKEILQYSDAQIILLECINCENSDQLHAIERRYIEKNKCCNKVIPTRTKKEYQETNKEHNREKQKEYYKKNKEQNKEHRKEYYEKNKEHIKEYYEKNKDQFRERHKKYNEINKDQRHKNQKQYDKFRRSEIGIFLRSFNFKCSCEV